jgi:ribosomal protein S18 acetylase RimI-like enzyme
MLNFRKALNEDSDAIWSIVEPIIRHGDTWVFAADSSREKMLGYFLSTEKHTFVAMNGERIVGVFFLKDNQPDLGSHICNAGYMVAADCMGKGIGKEMCRFSMQEARKLGYLSMQFNIVIKTNDNAVHLWKSMGFEVVGEIPEAFLHPTKGLTNAYVMYQSLKSKP